MIIKTLNDICDNKLASKTVFEIKRLVFAEKILILF